MTVNERLFREDLGYLRRYAPALTLFERDAVPFTPNASRHDWPLTAGGRLRLIRPTRLSGISERSPCHQPGTYH